ncbi:MAG TPA: chromosomal replication initiator protein DnaA [Caulobacteraceae bacterium]|nr:chromosomal replication initiator protein DnaA [Caulobacteraceae bacterium]
MTMTAVRAATAPAAMVWSKVGQALKSEIGEAAFGSWIAQAAVRQVADGDLRLVTPTGIARDWIRRNAWGRIENLWAECDPHARALRLQCRLEFEADSGDAHDAGLPPRPSAQRLVVAPAAEPANRIGGAFQERYTFDTFVIGRTNEFASQVARRIASWGDGHFNPVVFHGPYGFGKTHLLNALGWEAMRTPGRKVVYLTAERYISGFVRSCQERRASAFTDELRSADLLLVDDVQFIGGKQQTQEELLHTLGALMEDGRRVVFSADRPPSALTEIDVRLRSHLSSGLVCGIDPADRELRLGILERKLEALCRLQGLRGRFSPDILEFLADRFTESVRELEGALNTLIVRAGGALSTLRLPEAQAFLQTQLRGADKRITVDDIQKAVADHFGLKQSDLISERRSRSVARPRQAAMWLAKQLTTRSLPDIGRRFGGRDHTTVLHAVRRIEALRGGDAQLARDLEVLVCRLRG